MYSKSYRMENNCCGSAGSISHFPAVMKTILFVICALLAQALPAFAANIGSSWSNVWAFAAIRSNGEVVAWGDPSSGGDLPPAINANLAKIKAEAIYSTSTAFCVVYSDGTLKAWGAPSAGGTTPALTQPVRRVYSSQGAFAAILFDNSVVSWGDAIYGATTPSPVPASVTDVYSNVYAFAAVRFDKSVQCWGNAAYGGTAPAGLTGVVYVYSSNHAFAALMSNTSVVAWGSAFNGGVAPAGLTGVKTITATSAAFAALKNDDTVVVWGQKSNGGVFPAGPIKSVRSVFSTLFAFTALHFNGTLSVWGHNFTSNSNTKTPDILPPTEFHNFTYVYTTTQAFAGVTANGSLFAWGPQAFGGLGPVSLQTAGNTISGPGSVKVVTVVSNDFSFCAIMSDSSVQCFGDAANGGQGPPQGLNKNIRAVYGGAKAFAALTTVAGSDLPSVIAWGLAYAGGNITTVPTGKHSDISMVYGTTLYRSNSDGAQVYACDTGYYGYAYGECSKCASGMTTQYGASASTAAACLSPIPSTTPTPMPSFSPTEFPTTAPEVLSTVKKPEKIGIAVGAVCGIAITMFAVYYGCYSKDENVTIGPNMMKRKQEGANFDDSTTALRGGGGKSKNPLHNREPDLL